MHDILYRTLAQIETLPNGVGAVADLKRLLVCRGGFTLEAAEALLGESALASLSLLRRWTLLRLESERYAPDVLVEAALTPDASAHAAHHIFCLALARAHDQRQDYAGLNIESDNLTAAFEWAMDAGEGEKALALLNATGHFLLNRGRAREFATQAQRVSAALAEHPDKQVWANAQNTLGNAYSDLAAVEERAANLKRAVECYQRALEHYTPDAASLGYAATQDNLGLAYKKLKDKDKARAAFQEAEHYFRQMGDVDNAEKAWAQQRVFN
jgi:tetratricopeptide (TPR) repeat protein